MIDTPAPDAQQPTVTYTVSESETVTEAVVAALETATDRSTAPGVRSVPHDDHVLKPLYRSIDPDALDALFAGSRDDPEANVTIEFTHCGHEVTVTASGTVTVTAV